MKMNSCILIILLLPLLLLSSCNNKSQQAEPINEKVKVQVVRLEEREVEQVVVFTATVQAEAVNNIAPQTAVRIKKVYVEVGDHVRAGQKLADMDAANLTQAYLQLDNARIEFERVDELYKVGGISKAEWDIKKLTYDLAVTACENQVENTTLNSPISGMVTRRNYDSGDMYVMGAPIYVVEQIKPVKLLVNVSESFFTRVKKDMEVDVMLDVYGEEIFKGRVKLVYPTIDPQTRTFPVEIQIENKDERVRPGMFARVTFNYDRVVRVTLPDRAVMKQSGAADRYVYICREGQAHYRKVILGRRVGDEFEVIEGVERGEVVVVSGMNRLNSGTEVEIVKE